MNLNKLKVPTAKSSQNTTKRKANLVSNIAIEMPPPKGKKRLCQISPPDVLSDLPENVIHDILTCLPLRDAVRTCILSTKWRYKWRRLPELMLDQTLWKTEKHLADFNSYFIEVLCHILTLHAGPIAKFTLWIPHLESSPEIDDNVIYFLSRSRIQHLVLRLPFWNCRNKLPSSFFTDLQLRYLTLHNCSILPPPSFKGFDRLISLELRDVAISSKLLESLVSHCLLLEQLVLHLPTTRAGDVTEINALKLRSFDFSGSMRSIYLNSVPLLAKLSLTLKEHYVGTVKCNIAKFFENFSALEHLNLNGMFFVAGAGEVPKRLPYNLNCVKYLCISSIFLDCLIEVSFTLCLIRSFPYLQYLKIKVCCDEDDINLPALECLEVDGLSDVTFNHLREVKLILSDGSIREMQLMKLFLAKSPVLMRMLIEPWLIEQSATIKILTELTKFPRASPKAEVIYNLDKHPYSFPV